MEANEARILSNGARQNLVWQAAAEREAREAQASEVRSRAALLHAGLNVAIEKNARQAMGITEYVYKEPLPTGSTNQEMQAIRDFAGMVATQLLELLTGEGFKTSMVIIGDGKETGGQVDRQAEYYLIRFTVSW